MSHETLEIVIPLLIALSAWIPQLAQWYGNRKKVEAETQSALSDAVEGAGQTLSGAWKRIDDLEAKVRKLEEDLQKWRNYAARLIKRLKEVDPKGEVPPFDTGERMKAVK